MKINVAIVAGGNSSEYQISVNSAQQVFSHLDKDRFYPLIVIIRGREWFLQKDESSGSAIDKNDFSVTLNGKKLTFDVVFNAIHGTPGEDGKLQSYFDMIGIPYTGSGSFSSALSFNKYACKLYLEKFGIPTAWSILIRSEDNWEQRIEEEKLPYPCFVKPNNSGSSFGVSRVVSQKNLPSAINAALQEDDEIIIEEFIEGTEVTCGVLKTVGKEYLFPVTEIISKKEFFDYEAKYEPGMAEVITPARIKDTETNEIHKLSSVIYSALNCRGVVRIDFILSKGKPYFLEVNGIPGLSAKSIIPKQAELYGLKLEDFYSLLIEDAISRS